jgi:CRP-like cAMP-binding protein
MSNDAKHDDRVLLPPEMAQEFRNPKWGANQLKGIAILRCFTDKELERLYSQGQIISYKPKAYAVIEGEPSRGLFIILHGTVSVYKNDLASGAMHRLAFLDEGDSFGELSLFDTAPRSATVSAESVCHLFSLEAGMFERFLDQVGDEAKIRFYRTCAEELVGRFRKLNGDYIASQQLLWKHALNKPTDKSEKSLESQRVAGGR